jgi:predicted esterase YcpF (UPF0227 family)
MGLHGFNLSPDNSYKNLVRQLLVQILTVLPNPPAQVMKEIQDIFYQFVWDEKPEKN